MISRRDFLARTAGTAAAAGTLASMVREIEASPFFARLPLGLPLGGQVYPTGSASWKAACRGSTR